MEQFPNEGDDIQVIHHGADILQYCTADRNVPVYFFSYTGIFSHRYITSISKFFFSAQAKFKFAAERQLASLVEWAKHIPHFTELPLEDQVTIMRMIVMLMIMTFMIVMLIMILIMSQAYPSLH